MFATVPAAPSFLALRPHHFWPRRSNGGGGGGSNGGGGGSGGGGSGGSGGGGGGVGGGSGGSTGSGGIGNSGTCGGGTGAWRGGLGGGQRQQQQRPSETQSPQQLREWLAQCGTSGGSDSCSYVIFTGVRAGQTCEKLHTQHRCFSRLDDAWRAEFGDDVELPRWADLLRSRIAIFDLDFDAILSAMYAMSIIAEGGCYRCVPPDLGIAAAALGASETTLAALGFAPAAADPSLFLRTDTSLPPFYVLVYIEDLVLQRFGFQFSLPQPTLLSSSHSLSAPSLDESVEPSGPYPELVGCLMTTLAALGFAPAAADPSLFLRTDTSLPPFYVLVYIEDLVLQRFGFQFSLPQPTLLSSSHSLSAPSLDESVEPSGPYPELVGCLMTTLAALGFAPAAADPSLFLRTDTSLPPFYVLVYIEDLVLQRFGFQFSLPQPTLLSSSHSLSAPSLDESVEPSGPYPELVGCLMYLMTCTRPDLAYPLSLLARYMAPGRHLK
ncbi:unnamed protein product, partial [Closterium sp. NIES-54]